VDAPTAQDWWTLCVMSTTARGSSRQTLFKEGVLEGEAARDDHGRRYEIFDRITRKPLVASQEEIAINPRARSAKLRVVEKIEPTWG
jgi:Predicted S-adenosylmethionine-dependent methyltransferase involved in cell envelope biogenesis